MGNVAEETTHPKLVDLNRTRRVMDSLLEGLKELKREAEEKIVYNPTVRGPALATAGFGLVWFGALSPNLVLQNVAIPAGSIAVISGALDFGLR